MKNLLIIAMLFALAVTMSCNEDGPTDEELNQPLSVEENKEKMQTTGEDFIDELSGMESLTSVKAVVSMGYILDDMMYEEEAQFRFAGQKSILRLTKSIYGFAHGEITPMAFARSSYQIGQDDPESLKQLFDDNSGTYTWNADSADFIYEDNSNAEVIFLYPAEPDGTSNNAKLTLSNYTGVEIGNPLDDDYLGDLPTSLNVSMTVDGTEVMSYSFAVTYNSEGIPSNLTTTLTMEDYSLSASILNTNSKIGTELSFKKSDKLLMGTSFEANGTFTEAAFDAADANEDASEVVKNANFSYTIMDLKIEGSVDVDGLWPAIYDIDTYHSSYSEEARPDLEGNAEKIENALAQYGSLSMKYVSSGQKAANVEFYTYIDKREDVDYTEEWIELGVRMVFADDSKMDVEDYFASGFESLELAINNQLDAFSAEYDETIDNVEF